MTLFEELQARGLIHQFSEHDEVPLPKLLRTPQTVYAGFDPTASSLHIGNLIPLLGLKRFQERGHRVIVLAGGATGMVGDPSGKSQERNLLDRETLAANVAAVKKEIEKFLDLSDPNRGVLVDNLDWTQDVTYLDFLRDIGKHFTINEMMRKKSVQARLDRDSGEGISYTEFSYMLLQAFDFYHLAKTEDCTIQIGGSDQWGNITAGTDLIRRKLRKSAYGMTLPLLLDSDGSKFGKTAGGGTVWLDPARTNPLEFRQFWFKTTDADVIHRLKYFTFLPLEEIGHIEEGMADTPNSAQRRLAEVMTAMVHGDAVEAEVEKAIEMFFSKNVDWRQFPVDYLESALEGAPKVDLARDRFDGEGIGWLDLVNEVVHGGKSKSAARRDITQNAIALNGTKVADLDARVKGDDLLHDRFLVVKKGKKNHFLVRVTD